MSYNLLGPPEHLKPFVQYFWQAEIFLENKKSFTHISTASSSPGLQFYFDGGFNSAKNCSFKTFERTAIFHGQTNDAKDFITSGNAGIFGVKFYPYAIPAFFAIPAIEMTNQMLILNLLLGNKGTELAENIFFANNFVERMDILVLFLTNSLKLTNQLDKKIINSVHLINAQNGNTSIEGLSRATCLSERQFGRKFKELVGFSPKSYAKIVRFEYAKAYFETSPHSLTDTAISCGYYDQAHFNHDFKTFSGYNPKDYFRNYSELKLV